MSEPLPFEAITVGQGFTTPGIVVTETHVVQFAGLSGDFFEVHMDDRFAQATGFPRRVAHGLLCLALVDGLKNRATTRFAAIASLEWRYRFRQPVFFGDRIEGRLRVLDKRLTSRPGRGILRLSIEVWNQDEILIQEGINVLMVQAAAATHQPGA